jgi:hypothetical protein
MNPLLRRVGSCGVGAISIAKGYTMCKIPLVDANLRCVPLLKGGSLEAMLAMPDSLISRMNPLLRDIHTSWLTR